jgi:hypothetical protein
VRSMAAAARASALREEICLSRAVGPDTVSDRIRADEKAFGHQAGRRPGRLDGRDVARPV